FGRDDEAGIVEALRTGGHSRVSLVAEVGGRVVGHILFSDLSVLTNDGTVPALSLAPMAVLPEFQRRGGGAGPGGGGAGGWRGGGAPIGLGLGPPGLLPPVGVLGGAGRADVEPVPRGRGVDGRGVGAGDAGRRDRVGPLPAAVRGRGAGPPRLPARPGRVGADAHRPLPDDGEAGHGDDVGSFFVTGTFRWSEALLPWKVLVAERPTGGLCGFVEASIRPFVDGCTTRPVGYVEGWFVDPDVRRQGVGRKLVTAAEEWAAGQGCVEMASDALLGNADS